MSTEKQRDYSALTSEIFREYLEQILETLPVNDLLGIGDVHSILAEHFNNQVLEAWERDNPEDGPEETEEDDSSNPAVTGSFYI